ncbi:uncharacterized protein ARB_02896 [Trichophyton benhamiae CBS 112371]|uniref:Uncharacterized protein n=1 Tax=Arthroderma benhamiae (strain ATCC MYA-4681 / CBS 112371) TaxID=663331 RepID=D4B362_ARTBC|nr:uncharacterized protein ARB_02896 [Trichophyton benhamiae CBS 112371]EFE30217.1 hypothetical protein ARB_02896 [Trichophyton benhamiae CBS 112371]
MLARSRRRLEQETGADVDVDADVHLQFFPFWQSVMIRLDDKTDRETPEKIRDTIRERVTRKAQPFFPPYYLSIKWRGNKNGGEREAKKSKTSTASRCLEKEKKRSSQGKGGTLKVG